MNVELDMEWHLEALKKVLVKLSSPAEKQVSMMETHDIPLSMSADFDCHFLHIRQEFNASGLLSSEQFEVLDKVDVYFKKKTPTRLKRMSSMPSGKIGSNCLHIPTGSV